MAEADAARRALGVSYITALDCDVWVYSVKRLATLRGYTPKGGGGTDMRVALEYIRDKLNVRRGVTIIFTDGDTPWPDDPPPFEVVVALLDGDRYVPDWARKVVVGDDV